MLKKIKLENFRNHKSYELELGDITAIIGENGAGKSNILEAITLISLCRSFREDDKKVLVHLDFEYARVIGDDLEIFIQRSPLLTRAKERGVAKKQAEFVGLLKCVVFSPESTDLIFDGPKLRRKFLDIMISQEDRDYLRALIAYEKVRSERNSLLQSLYAGHGSENELDFWDNELIKHGEIIEGKRAAAAEFLNQKLPTIYRDIAGNKTDKLEIILESNCDNFRGKLLANRRREIASGHTETGPHRDDLKFVLNSQNAANFASRGEARSIILALKIAELEYVSEKSGEKPILLLDDVFSEFDSKRRMALNEIVKKYQTVITTTDREHLSEELLAGAKIVELEQAS